MTNALDRINVAAIGISAGDLVERVRAAETAGAECVWAPELFRSSITQATLLAAETEKVGVGTGIAWAFVRSPFIAALSALDIDEISGGRFRLGVGAGVKRLNETWHGVEYGKPAPHLREFIQAVREIMAKAHKGEPIRFEGEYYDLDIKGWFRPHPPARERIPIYAAAVQEGMCRMAGDVADGLLGHPVASPKWLDEVMIPNFERGLERSGRNRSEFDFVPTVCCAIDDDEGRARNAARKTIAFYATVRTYKPLWDMHGFAAEAQRVGEAFRSGDLGAMSEHVTDEMVETYTAAGPAAKVRDRVEQVAQKADALFLTPPTYFIAPDELFAYQDRILAEFGTA